MSKTVIKDWEENLQPSLDSVRPNEAIRRSKRRKDLERIFVNSAGSCLIHLHYELYGLTRGLYYQKKIETLKYG